MPKTVLVAGHICLDVTPKFPEHDARSVGSVLQPGKLVAVDGVDIHVGGAVANTGLALKRLGVPVRLTGKVGDDDFGRLVAAALDEYGAGQDLIVCAGARTSYSIVLAIPGLDRIFLHDPGANDTFASDDLDSSLLDGIDLVHFGYPPLMKRLYADGGSELADLLRRIKHCGKAVSLDLAAIDPASEAGRADWRAILREALPFVDFFVPSAEELCAAMDPAMYERWAEEAPNEDVLSAVRPADLGRLADMCLNWGARVVLIKCGQYGLYCKSAAAEELVDLCKQLSLEPAQWADKECFESSFVPDAVVSGTGAGDTCIAAFLAAVLHGDSLFEALAMGAGCGACCVAAYDALSGLPTAEELRMRIRAGWSKNYDVRFSDIETMRLKEV